MAQGFGQLSPFCLVSAPRDHWLTKSFPLGGLLFPSQLTDLTLHAIQSGAFTLQHQRHWYQPQSAVTPESSG